MTTYSSSRGDFVTARDGFATIWRDESCETVAIPCCIFDVDGWADIIVSEDGTIHIPEPEADNG